MNSLTTMMQALAVRLYSHIPTSANRQKGASALEYIVLAAVIVIAVSVGALLLGGGTIEGVFQDIQDAITD